MALVDAAVVVNREGDISLDAGQTLVNTILNLEDISKRSIG
jgi:hypothetical protein